MPYSTSTRPRSAPGTSQSWVDEAFRTVLGDDLESLRSAGVPERVGVPAANVLRTRLLERFTDEKDELGRRITVWVPPGPGRLPGGPEIRDEPRSEFLAHRAILLCTDALTALQRVQMVASVEHVAFAGEVERFEGLRTTIGLKIGALRTELTGLPDQGRVEQLFDTLLTSAIRELREIALPDRTLSGSAALRVRAALHTLEYDLRCLQEGWEAVGTDDLVVGLYRVRVSVAAFEYSLDRTLAAFEDEEIQPRDLDVTPAPGLETWTPTEFDPDGSCDDHRPIVTVGNFLQRCRDEAALWSAEVDAAGASGARGIRQSVHSIREATEKLARALSDMIGKAGTGGRGRATRQEAPPVDPVYGILHDQVSRFRLELAEIYRGICQVVSSQEGEQFERHLPAAEVAPDDAPTAK